MSVVETVMTEKEWKKHNKDWLEGYVLAETNQRFNRGNVDKTFRNFPG